MLVSSPMGKSYPTPDPLTDAIGLCQNSDPPRLSAKDSGIDHIPELAVGDKYLEQEILWGSFSEAVKGTPDEEFKNHREKDADCRQCGRDGHKTRACYAQTTTKGTKLAPPPKLLSGKTAAAGT